jgi:CheY-like chemotaxis protein
MNEQKGKTVLVVDDEPDVRFYLQTILEDAGFEVLLAANGREALDILEENEPDVISLDLVMPKTTGLKFFLHLQKTKDKAEIPIVVVTAHGKDEFGQKYLEQLQAEPRRCELFYLEKPVKPAIYLNTIRKALGLPVEKEEDGEQATLRKQLRDKINAGDKETLLKVLKALK